MLQRPKRTFRQDIDTARWLAKFPAYSVAVLLRWDLGYRLVSPAPFIIMFSLMMLIALNDANSQYHPLGLAIFASAMLAACLIQRFCRRQEIKRGVPNHSYFIGSSWFRTRKWHPWFYQHRRLEKFVDPIATVLIGLALLNISILPAIWILCSGFCLFVLETTIQRRDLHRQLDTLDGLVDSEAMSENVEHFSEAPTQSHNPQVEPGIPTGIGDDIREKVETNKKNKAP